jgi:hypothetical protein
MRNAVTRDLRALFGHCLTAPVRIDVDARTGIYEGQRSLRCRYRPMTSLVLPSGVVGRLPDVFLGERLDNVCHRSIVVLVFP